jgi:hypothetical protein
MIIAMAFLWVLLEQTRVPAQQHCCCHAKWGSSNNKHLAACTGLLTFEEQGAFLDKIQTLFARCTQRAAEQCPVLLGPARLLKASCCRPELIARQLRSLQLPLAY